MIVYALALVAAILSALPAVGGRWFRSLHPAVATKAVAVSLVGALVVAELTLVALGAPVVLRAAGAHGLAARCERMASQMLIGSPWIGRPAALAALVLPFLVATGFRRARRAQRSLHEVALIGGPAQLLGHSVVMFESDRPLAVSVAAHGGVIVVSSALVNQLADAELAAVLRHERAHLDHRHHVLLWVASGAEIGLGFVPWVRSAVDQLRCSIERWADEDAAGPEMDARWVTKRALIGVATGGVSVDLAAFGSLSTVVERVVALDRPAPVQSGKRSTLAFAPLVALWTGALFAVAVVIANFWLVLTMSTFCSA